jgi:hypothetical protein
MVLNDYEYDGNACEVTAVKFDDDGTTLAVGTR